MVSSNQDAYLIEDLNPIEGLVSKWLKVDQVDK